MNLNKQELIQILEHFNINENVESWDELVHIENRIDEKYVLKHYFRVHTEVSSYILKLLSLPMCSTILLEGQSRFSEFYRANGIPTPKRFLSIKGNYLLPWVWKNKDIYISIESDAGMQISHFSKETIIIMGKMLGRMHKISEENQCHFQPGSLYLEFKSGKTTYLPLWKSVGTDFLPQELFKEIQNAYDEHLKTMRADWEHLPRFAVQSDMYRMNLTIKDGEIQLIDYDRVGDEVLLADLLVTWFRFRFDPFIREYFVNLDSSEYWHLFFESYLSERELLPEEQNALKYMYGIIGAVFCTKMLVSEAVKGNRDYASNQLNLILEVLKGYGL